MLTGATPAGLRELNRKEAVRLIGPLANIASETEVAALLRYHKEIIEYRDKARVCKQKCTRIVGHLKNRERKYGMDRPRD